MPWIFGEKIQAGDIQSKLASFSEFADVGASAEYFLLGDVGGEHDERMIDVEHFILDESKNSGRLVIN